MLKPDDNPFLSVSHHDNSKPQLFFRLDVPSGQDLGIQPGESARLVKDASRPTFLGCCWDSDGDDEESARARCESRIRLPGCGQVRLTWTLRLDYSFSAESFLPVDKKHYGTDVQIDRKARTIWWPLPAGRSVNGLSDLLGFEDHTLYEFVQRWFWDKDANRPLPFHLSDDTGVSYNEAAWMIACHSEDEAAMDWVSIPDELLRDPIRNGSTDPSDGHNPWNEGQKAAIVAHLEHELARLTTLFQQEFAPPTVDHVLA